MEKMKTLDKTAKISSNIIGNRGVVIISKKEYCDFLLYKKDIQKRTEEEMDTNEAIGVYKKEKKAGKLKKLKSLTDLD